MYARNWILSNEYDILGVEVPGFHRTPSELYYVTPRTLRPLRCEVHLLSLLSFLQGGVISLRFIGRPARFYQADLAWLYSEMFS